MAEMLLTGGVRIGGVNLPPVLCDTCGLAFRNLATSGQFVGWTVMTPEQLGQGQPYDYSDVHAEPCSRCGGRGSVAQDLLDALMTATRQLQGRPVSDLLRMRDHFKESVWDRTTDLDALADEVERIDSAWKPIADFIRSRENRMEVWTILAFTVPIILYLLLAQGVGAPPADSNLDNEVTRIVVEQPPEWAPQERNERCECGSGRKAKRCHGAPSSLRPSAIVHPSSTTSTTPAPDRAGTRPAPNP